LGNIEYKNGNFDIALVSTYETIDKYLMTDEGSLINFKIIRIKNIKAAGSRGDYWKLWWMYSFSGPGNKGRYLCGKYWSII
jgi:hypothetical protein